MRVSLQYRAASGHNPAGEGRYYERACVNGACLAVHVCSDKTEHEYLREEYDKQRHERSAERRAEKQVRAWSESCEERNVFKQDDEEDAASHAD